MSHCNASFLIVPENIIVNSTSKNLEKIFKNLINGRFSISDVTEYAYQLIPVMIPVVATVFIPILVYLFVNRFRFKLTQHANVIVFLLINSIVILFTCFSFVYSYNLVLGLKNIICNTQTIILDTYYKFLEFLNILNSKCLDVSTPDFNDLTHQILDTLETINSYINIYYSLVLVFLQVFLIPVLLFTSILFEKCTRKVFFYLFFAIIITLSWLLGSLFFSLAFVTSDLQNMLDDLFKNPFYYFENNCVIGDDNMKFTPCNMMKQCNDQPNRNLMIGLLNGSETETYEVLLNNMVFDSIECKNKTFSALIDINIPCSTITQARNLGLTVLANSSIFYFISTALTCIMSFTILPFFTKPGKGRVIKLPQLKYSIQ